MSAVSNDIGEPAGGTRHRRPRIRRTKWIAAGFAAVALVGAAGAAGIANAGTTAHTDAVPAPPAGFTLTFSDDFTGAAGAGVDTGAVRYDTGPGS
jgi:hypothetical protein